MLKIRHIASGLALLIPATQSAVAADIASIVFLLDESGSVGGTDALSIRSSLIQSLSGSDSVLPTDSTAMISIVIGMEVDTWLAVPPTIIDSESTLNTTLAGFLIMI